MRPPPRYVQMFLKNQIIHGGGDRQKSYGLGFKLQKESSNEKMTPSDRAVKWLWHSGDRPGLWASCFVFVIINEQGVIAVSFWYVYMDTN